jgi:CheY-like chemotaxis protein
MAKLATERFLVLLVDDAGYDCLSIQLPRTERGRLSFIGSMSDGHDLITYLHQSGESDESARLPLSDLLLLGLMMPREEGIGIVQWLQSQPFEGVTVVVLDDQLKVPRPSVAQSAA